MQKGYEFCPRCGGKLTWGYPHGTREEPAQPICPSCGFIFWQASKPCAGVLVIRDDKLLLIRRAIEPYKGWWDVPGGFLAEGEHPEAGAVREVREETGLDIRLTGFVGIFMDVYETTGEATLNVFYTGEVLGGSEMAGSDAAAMRWFDKDVLPDQIAFVCCRQAIEAWKKR